MLLLEPEGLKWNVHSSTGTAGPNLRISREVLCRGRVELRRVLKSNHDVYQDSLGLSR